MSLEPRVIVAGEVSKIIRVSDSSAWSKDRHSKSHRGFLPSPIRLLQNCAPRSPDLNPVELFWAWLRKRLRALDLRDAVNKTAVLGKTAYKERVRRVVKTQKAMTVAGRVTLRLRKVCKEVLKKRGAATTG